MNDRDNELKAVQPDATSWNAFWGRKGSKQFGQISWSKQRILNILKRHCQPGMVALDAGCGSGFFSRFFIEQGLKACSLDYSKEALEMARKSTEGQAQLMEADLLKEDLSNLTTERFDIIFSDGLLEHFTMEQQSQILSNFKSVLRSSGKVVTFVPNRWSPWELIRPFYMPGIEEKPFVLSALKGLHEHNSLVVKELGGINVLPFRFSPEKLFGSTFGMLLYVIAENK